MRARWVTLLEPGMLTLPSTLDVGFMGFTF
jgi:hypothetical protein